jgi:phosphate transport system substrate-binding protein
VKKRTSFAAAAALVVAALTVAGASARNSDTTITGAGSTFVQPLVQTWIQPVGAAFGYTLQYSGIGSGGGIAAITNRTVDFGASDAPLTPDQFAACNGCAQIPWALSATAVLYNLPHVKNDLHMTGPVLAKIFEGKITSWSDPAIRRLNRGVSLPATSISIVHRSDNSGTTYNFTDYLSTVSSEWRTKIGKGVSVEWPTGTGGKGSSGVAALVSQTPGAIGYADVAYALKNHLQFFAMQNRAGRFTVPGLVQIAAAAKSDIKPAADNSLSIVNPGRKYKAAYPICTFTYVIVPLKTSKATELRRFLLWALTKGQSYGPRLLFVPVPKSVLVVSEKTVKKVSS